MQILTFPSLSPAAAALPKNPAASVPRSKRATVYTTVRLICVLKRVGETKCATDNERDAEVVYWPARPCLPLCLVMPDVPRQ